MDEGLSCWGACDIYIKVIQYTFLKIEMQQLNRYL